MPQLNKAAERNLQVSSLLSQLFDAVTQDELTPDEQIIQSLEVLFSTQTWGFREIVLVIAMARLLDSSYRATENFYACNPRSLFEKPIRQELDKRGIPSRQSGPLNVAKGAERINSQWAAGREPRHVADEVVTLVHQIERMSRDDLEHFTKLLLERFLKEARAVQALTVRVEPVVDPTFLYRLCKGLIDTAPDGGNTPQRIVGYLLQSYHISLQTGIHVRGHTDRASTTSTTSKKLGDITEELEDGVIMTVYEVTVKSFGEQRVREAYESAHAYTIQSNINTQEIMILCRKQDVYPGLEMITSCYLGRLEYQDMIFHYVDIYEWIVAQLLRMTTDARAMFFEQLQVYVTDKNTSVNVKLAWSRLTALAA
jgi:hypothetical protein